MDLYVLFDEYTELEIFTDINFIEIQLVLYVLCYFEYIVKNLTFRNFQQTKYEYFEKYENVRKIRNKNPEI